MANANTESYVPLRIARSDGRSYNIDDLEKGWKEEERTQAVDQDGDQPSRWKASIGAHLKYQLAPPDDNQLYILKEFPSGYELRIQNKKDKVQAYLYGHPKDSKARFRTPGDAIPHLLWLISESTDWNDCSCQFCGEMIAREALPETVTAPRPIPVPNIPSKPAAVSTTTNVGSQGTPAVNIPTSTSAQAPQVRAQSTTAPPGTTGLANVFRVGELVWYKHSAWRLGVILTISSPTATTNPGADEFSYEFGIAALGHHLLLQPNVTKRAFEMRPFLTFSVPNISSPELQGKTFQTVNWSLFIAQSLNQEADPSRREHRAQILRLEASKMAARHINDQFSTFNEYASGASNNAQFATTASYGGVFLGAEMVLVGDAIRIASKPGAEQPLPGQPPTTVMLVQEIAVTQSPPNGIPSLQFRGTVYGLGREQPGQPATEQPGPALSEEAAFRNELGGPRLAWAALERGAARPEADVLGRFYAGHKLLRVLDPDAFAANMAARRPVGDAQSHLNGRAQGGEGRVGGWVPDRAAALQGAVGSAIPWPEGIVEAGTQAAYQ